MILGQGLAGSAIAWTQHWAGQTVLLIDRGEANSASRVAAGLVTPVTGKRLVKSPEYEADWAVAVAFYSRIEAETGQSLFQERSMLRLFSDESSRAAFITRSDEAMAADVESWEGQLQAAGRVQPGMVMQPAGRLNVVAYLTATRRFFEERDGYQGGEVDLATDVKLSERRVALPRFNVTAERLIVCQGASTNTLFPGVPNNPSRGDILTVRIPDYIRSEVVHRSVWIAPNSDGTQSVGATYDWQCTAPEPTAAGRDEVLKKLSRMVEGEVVVEDHQAGVRPTMKDYGPVLGSHPTYRNVFVFNGLGSKGTLKAPRLALTLCQHIVEGTALPSEQRYARLASHPQGDRRRRPLTQLAQEAVASVLKDGDIAIDATVGNGFDTCFLSRQVGPAGQVIGYDVQQTALEATKRRLTAEGLNNVKLLHQGHESLATEVVANGHIAAVMFNLGFLPRSDHSIITQPHTSTAAIAAAIELLKPGGVLTVLAYRGHEGGQEEFVAVERLLRTFAEQYDLVQINSTPPKSTSPVLYVLRKTGKST